MTRKRKKPAHAQPQPAAPPSPWRTVLLVAAALFAVKIALSLPITGPWFEPDETTYAVRACHVAAGDGLSWQHPGRGLGKEGYAAFLALPWLLAGNNPDRFIRLAHAANALLAAMSLVVGYAVLRRWFPHRPALLGALAMVLYAAVFLYGFAMLSENLFFFLCLISVWLVQRLALAPRWHWWALAGAAVALSCVTRVAGAVLIVAFGLVAICHLVRTRTLQALAGAAAAGLALTVVLGTSFLLTRPPAPTQQPAVAPVSPPPSTASAPEAPTILDEAPPGSYQTVLRNLRDSVARVLDQPRVLSDIARSLVLGLAYTLLAGLLVLPVAAAMFALRSWRDPAGTGRPTLNLEILFVALVILGTLALHAVLLGLTSQATDARKMHGRYVDVAAMLLVGYGLASVLAGDAARRRPSAIIALVAAALALAAVLSLPAENPLFSANLGAFYALQLPAGSRWILFLLPLLALVALLPPVLRNHPRAVGGLLAVLLLLNTVFAHRALLDFVHEQFQVFHAFGRGGARALADHFRRHPDAEPLVYIDKVLEEPDSNLQRLDPGFAFLPPDQRNQARMLGISALELWTPGLRVLELSVDRRALPNSLVFSVNRLQFPEVYRNEFLCIYHIETTPPATGANPSPPRS